MKLKTHKATAKRLMVTRTGKVVKRAAGQDHFNARESGTVTRRKRLDTELSVTHAKNAKTFMPYNK